VKARVYESLNIKITLIFVVLVIILLGVSLGIAGLSFRSSLNRYLMQSPINIAESVARELNPLLSSDASLEEIQKKLGQLSEKYGAEIVVYDRNGNPVITSGIDRTTCDTPWCEGPMGRVAARTVAVPVIDGGRVIGFVGVILNRETSIMGTIDRFRRSMYISLLTSGLLLVLVAALLVYFISNAVTRPLRSAAEVARAISEGNYNKRCEVVDGSEIGILQETLNILAEKLRTIEERRLQMASDIAHEFKTPLTVIKANLEAMADGVVQATPDRIQHLINEIERLDDLVSELKTIHDLDGKESVLNLERIELSEFAADMIEIYRPLAESRNLAVEAELDKAFIKADRKLLQRIFENVFSNAVSYTDAGGRIVVRTYDSGRNGCLEIEDTGIGIKKEEIPLVFERFYRAEGSRSRKTGGSGLGLSIVKKLVEIQNGNIFLDSELGKGTVVKICLPSA
jgi:signal transduction histidine kinase